MKKYTYLLAICSLSFTLNAQLTVDTVPGFRKVVLEEFAGIQCPYTPAGAKVADELKSEYPGDVFIMHHYVSFYGQITDSKQLDLRVPFAELMFSICGPSAIPAGNVNRHIFPAYNSSGKPAMLRQYFHDAADSILSKPSPVNMAAECHYYPGDTVLTINVSMYYTDDVNDSVYLNVAILQDSIVGYQLGTAVYPQRYLNSLDPYSYVHMNVFRQNVNGDWGHTVQPHVKGDRVNKTYQFPVSEFNNVPRKMKDLHIVAYVSEKQTLSEIITSIGARAAERPLSVRDYEEDLNLSVYPNPVQNLANVEFSLKDEARIRVSLYDMSGKNVQESGTRLFQSGVNRMSFDVSRLQPGIYFVHLSDGKQRVVKKVIVAG